MRTLTRISGTLLVLVCLAHPAVARHYHYAPRRAPAWASTWTWTSFEAPTAYSGSGVVGGRPVGAPRAYCGYGTSVYIFGHAVPSLFSAAAWLRFPRASFPSRGMAVVFGRYHVAAVAGGSCPGGQTLLYDPNSGGGLTRLHCVDIHRATLVDPSGGRTF